jgi:hypothetical protein
LEELDGGAFVGLINDNLEESGAQDCARRTHGEGKQRQGVKLAAGENGVKNGKELICRCQQNWTVTLFPSVSFSGGEAVHYCSALRVFHYSALRPANSPPEFNCYLVIEVSYVN